VTLATRDRPASLPEMRHRELPLLLNELLELLSQAESPDDLDLEQTLIRLGSAPAEAELLADYLPAACGRAFLREIGVKTSDTYLRSNEDGSWGPPTLFADDPLWLDVEAFVETIRTDPNRRSKFGLVAQLSAEVDAINNAVHSGMSLAEMVGSSFASVFAAPLRHRNSGG
jgi:hypothetical protein